MLTMTENRVRMMIFAFLVSRRDFFSRLVVTTLTCQRCVRLEDGPARSCGTPPAFLGSGLDPGSRYTRAKIITIRRFYNIGNSWVTTRLKT